jgi:hypothetical protein
MSHATALSRNTVSITEQRKKRKQMVLLDNESLTECMNDVADIVQILGKIERMADGTR